MDDQLDLFKEYKVKLERVAGARHAAEIVSRSMYLVITGTDDLANTYFTTPFRRNYDLESYIEFVVRCASDFIKVQASRVETTALIDNNDSNNNNSNNNQCCARNCTVWAHGG
jgi:hypothetical protein